MNRKDELRKSIKGLKSKIARLQERMDKLYHELWETEAELEVRRLRKARRPRH